MFFLFCIFKNVAYLCIDNLKQSFFYLNADITLTITKEAFSIEVASFFY